MNLGIVSKIAAKTGLWASQHAPEILTGVGVVGFMGTCVTVGTGTLKAQKVISEMEEDKNIIDKARAYDPDYIEYSVADEKTDRAAIVIKSVKGLSKSYAPAICFGVLTISSFMGGQYLLRKRNIALLAAYGVLNDSFKKYRTNVITKYGEDEDYFLKNGITRQKIEIEEEIDGKKKKKKVDMDVIDDEPSGYSFIFDNDHSMMSVMDSTMARDILMMAENSANQLLIGRGYITLNEVLRSIGLQETSAGQIVGWTKKGDGDGYIDFNARQIRTAMDKDGVAFLLDFNVDGPIYQYIDKYNKRWGE